MKDLIDFAKEITHGERVDVVYSDDIRKTTIEKLRELSKEAKDKEVRQGILDGIDHYENQFKESNLRTFYWFGKGALSFYSNDMNHLGIVIDNDYKIFPEASKALIVHEVYETYWKRTEELYACGMAAKAAGHDNPHIPQKLGSQLFTIFFIKVLEDTREFIINKKVERDFPEEYNELTCSKLIENADSMKYYMQNSPIPINTDDIIYGLTEFLVALQANSESVPIETDDRQGVDVIKNIRDLKDSCLSVFSESQHPVHELSEEISKNLGSIPDKIGVLDIYPVFSNHFDIYDRFDDAIRPI